MADMDLDDLDGPSKIPSRKSRFAPKNSKLKPQPKPELKLEPVSTDQEPQESNSVPLKKEELDSRPALVDSVPAKKENEHMVHFAATGDDTVKMDVEAKSEGEEAKDDIMEEDDVEDMVVREIDVFFTPHVDSNSQIYVLQYPLRPCWRPYEMDERCEEVRVNPMNAEVEVDLAIDIDSKNYDTNADPRMRMTKQTLSSSMNPRLATGYAVGVLIGNELHINPIRAVVQLRPSTGHPKSGGSKKNSVGSNMQATIKSEDLKDEKSAGPSKKQNKLPGNLDESSNIIQESWVPLKFHSSKSDISVGYLRKMAVGERSPIQFSMSPYDYVSSLCPGAFSDNDKPKGPSRRFLLSLPLEQRFKTLLREGPAANRFDTLKHLAPNDSILDVLRVLQNLAHLIQGLWVPKTSLLLEGRQGVEVLARDYILLLFSKNPVISYDQVNVSGSLGEAIKRVLNILAIERPSLHDWKFKEQPDLTFMKLHPDIVKEEEQVWERVEKRLTASIFGGRRGPLTNNPRSSTNPSIGAASSSNGAVSGVSMPENTREALRKALQKVFQTDKVCRFNLILQRLREMALSESAPAKGTSRDARLAAYGFDAPQAQKELHAILSEVAININGVYVSKSSLDHPQYDDLREIVIKLLNGQGPNPKLKKASIVEAVKKELNRDITPIEYQKVMTELCVYQGSAWVLKRGDGNPN